MVAALRMLAKRPSLAAALAALLLLAGAGNAFATQDATVGGVLICHVAAGDPPAQAPGAPTRHGCCDQCVCCASVVLPAPAFLPARVARLIDCHLASAVPSEP